MKTSLILAITVLTSVNLAHADNPWASLQGCYLTEQRNGQPVDPSEANQWTDSIKLEDSAMMGFVMDADGKTIPTLGFYIFQKYSTPDNSASYDYKGAFSDMGTYSSDSAGSHFRFDGKLLYKNGGENLPFTLHETIDVQQVDAQRLLLHAVQTVPEITDGSMNSDDTYVIRRVVCRSST